ncbi:GH-E family nuclease [Phytopseudomonas dryadis]|uniref:GH-E family nuclease n=1 Tax=Pseudomonadaceae TaxID=135621 RepID=UPI00398350AA
MVSSNGGWSTAFPAHQGGGEVYGGSSIDPTISGPWHTGRPASGFNWPTWMSSEKSERDVAKDVTKRPSSFRKKTVQDSWDNAADSSKPGAKACPTCGKDVEVVPGQGRRDWDVDHQPKWKDRDLSGMDRKQVLDEYNKDVRLRCPSCNRSDN